MRDIRIAALLLTLLLSAAGPLFAAPSAAHHGMSTQTHCASCHVTENWKTVRFDHLAQTKVELRGAHALATCAGCHDAEFKKAVPESCSACHQDAHRGEFGVRCAGCHDENNWESRFTADAHRNTTFPLSGRHGMVACTECHGNVRDRSFSRTGIACVSCHQRDYAATTGSYVDHGVYNFSSACYDCHTGSRWTGARFREHEACFQLAAGPHSGVACLDCHSSLTGARPSGTCSTNTEACTHCHAHAQPKTDQQHANVPGYEYSDLKCYSCHKQVAPGSTPAARHPRRTP